MDIDVSTFSYHSSLELLVDALAARANTEDRHFLRTVIIFYLGIVTSTMRTKLILAGDRPVPLNIYAVALSASGSGKGVVTSAMEQLLSPLVSTFTERWTSLRDDYINQEAARKATKYGTDLTEEIEKTKREVYSLGTPLLWFEEGTSPAFKQMRSSLIKVPFGSLNFIVDEVFSVAYGEEMLQDLVKSYDIGALKSKLIKHTNDSKRVLDAPDALVPAQMLLFGTGSLLSDPTIQSTFLTQLESGLARRCIFAYSTELTRPTLDAKQRLLNLSSTNTHSLTNNFKTHINNMINEKWYNTHLTMDYPAQLYLMEYQMYCEERAKRVDNNILNIEMQHRYMRVAKIAGIYAVWDNKPNVSIGMLQSAIKFVEDGGDSIQGIVKSVPLHIKLAEHLAKSGENTMSQLVTDLPWFGGKPKPVKTELIQLATEYGHTHNIIISQATRRGIDYIKGSPITNTDMSKIILSVSDHQAFNYINGYIPWDRLHEMVTKQGIHWVNHHVADGHRSEESVIDGFNTVVIDIDNKQDSDSNVPIFMAKELLSDYKYLLYESKSSTPEYNRYRMVFPISHLLHLNEEVFKEFMLNVYTWLPIPSDEVTYQRSRKWLGYDSNYFYNDGMLLPALDFLPDTDRQRKKAKEAAALGSLPNIERWVISQCNDPSAGRNNTLLRYALLLKDAGISPDDIQAALLEINQKIIKPLPESEIITTIMVSVLR